MGEVPACGEIHPQNGVPRLEGGEIDGKIGIRAAVGLDIGVVCSEEPLRPLNGHLFNDIRLTVPPVISGSGISFKGPVGQYTPLDIQHGRRRKIGCGVQFECPGLIGRFIFNGGCDFRVY